MLKYEKVPERSKSRLKLKDIGYHGLISHLSDIPGSMLLFRCLSEQVLGAGTLCQRNQATHPSRGPSLVASHEAQLSWGLWWLLGTAGSVPALCCLSTDPPNYKDLVAVVYLSHRAELSIRLDICRKVSGARARREVTEVSPQG